YGTNRSQPLGDYCRMHQTSGTTAAPLRWLDTHESWSGLLDSWVRVFEESGVTAADRVMFPFAFGPFTPVDLSCTETSILVTVPLPPIPAVADITQGGNVVQNIELHATGLPSPISLARDGAGALYSANPDIFDVTIAGDFTDAAPFATGQDTTTLTWTGQALWAGVTGAPEIYDVTAGGDLSAAAPVVTLPTVGVGQIDGLLTTLDGTIYAVTGNQIYDVTAGGDLTGALPFATGLQSGQRGFTGMLEHVCSADSDCFDDDLCNGPERCVDNRCLPAEQPLSCDDDDACTNDGCQPADGCTHDPVPACCDEDLDCAVDALCDVEAMTCMPVGTVPTTGMDTESDDTAMVPTTGDTDGAEGDATGSGGEQDGEGNDGCGCRQSTREGGPWWALLVLAVAGRRRGRGSGRPATPS
ncbi:MAG: hypothetical protein K0V04_09815, partial [Deltaproteobacteria bacterium]|nr:hypothetical protein [Deltaproteobacteria bacterium]